MSLPVLTRRQAGRLLLGSAVAPLLPAAALAQGRMPALPLTPVESADLPKVNFAHAIAMHGEPRYAPTFTHFDYVNPEAPKGGTLVLSGTGTFDSFNPYILRGTPSGAVAQTFDTLLTSSMDEAFTEYGLVAERIRWPEDRSWVEFALNPAARFHDGTPIAAEDVVWTFETLKTRGHPQYRYYYASVSAAEKVAERRVKFSFVEGENRELPLIVGQLPVLPRHYWEGRDFEATTLEPPLGSGPYRVADFEPGRFVVLERVADYWGRDLPVNKGLYNFERIRVDYYRDRTIARQALKAGRIDLWLENQAKAWAADFDIPAVAEGRLIKEGIPNDRTAGMQGFVMNSRRKPFDDARVREAMSYAFDFEWTNRNLFFGQYVRNDSYFANSELASRGLPDGEELEILERYRGRLPDRVFTEIYQPPSTDGSGWPRANLRRSFELLDEAGWEVRDFRLANRETGEPFRFEILLVSPAFERIMLPYRFNLNRLGIDASIRLVDAAQYQNRLDGFDFDMVVGGWGQSDSPGNEQRDYWSSQAAETPGSRNLCGISDPVIDELIDLLIAAPSRESLVARTRALDRVLLAGRYVVPNWYVDVDRYLYWDKFERPDETPRQGTSYLLWWMKPAYRETAGRAAETASTEG